jgi:hypothetical protein
MGRRNRKKRLDSFMLPLPLAGAVVLLVATALAYVWLDCRCETLGREIRTFEKEQELLKRKCLNEEYKWMRLKSPVEIEKALQKFNIVMTWPRNEQVVRMTSTDVKENPPVRVAWQR